MFKEAGLGLVLVLDILFWGVPLKPPTPHTQLHSVALGQERCAVRGSISSLKQTCLRSTGDILAR